jgi:hypothetical protein
MASRDEVLETIKLWLQSGASVDGFVLLPGPPDEHGEMTRMARSFPDLKVVALSGDSMIAVGPSRKPIEFSMPSKSDFWLSVNDEGLQFIGWPKGKYGKRVEWELEPAGRLVVFAERFFK